MKVSYFIFILLLFLCCSTRTHITYRMYNTTNPGFVIDSISKSGTIVSDLTKMYYTDDDSTKVVSDVGTLYRNGKPCGSIHIQEKNNLYAIKIIDNIIK